jgi:photosystem II stability/assembly factor-like uncharacterized protein
MPSDTTRCRTSTTRTYSFPVLQAESIAALLLIGGFACGDTARSPADATGDGGVGSMSNNEGGSSSGDAARTVHACDSLAASGTWENITPPVAALPGAAPCPYGGAFVMNPLDTSTLYVGSCNEGIWKTTDCGATWTHINTGTNGPVLDGGRQWTFLIDPTNPEILYTNSGYGSSSNGAFKSIDGGVNWTQIWPPSDPALSSVVSYNFVGQLVMDPADRTHLLISFHATCAAPHAQACFGESKDSGTTWTLIDGESDWSGGEGQVIYFLDSSTTWLWGSQANGLWRTPDSGATWAAVTDTNGQGHATGELYRAKSGVFYLPTPNGILRSQDGMTWTAVPNSGDTMLGFVGNGTTMYASRGFPWDPSSVLYEPFWTSPETDGQTWTQLQSPMLSNGGQLEYDSTHHLLYSSDLGAGVWRVVAP